MKVLIIEDEARAANQLQRTLQLCNFQYDLLGIIDTVEDAINWFGTNSHPDLVFMDIQLADGLSFEIFQSVEVACPIIFTTAFDQYAIKAFKFNSVDYLLKPIKQEDLQASLEKFQKSKQATQIDTDKLSAIMAMMQPQQKASRSGILVKEGNAYVQIKVSDILYLYSADSITFAITAERRYIVDETLDQFLQTVDEAQFFRINRGQVVHKSAVIKIHPYLNHRLKVEVDNAGDQEFIVSRQRSSEFKQWMNG